MKGKFRFSLKRGLLRPSWNKYNIYNIARKQLPALNNRTLYQKKWNAKKETRSYHGPQLREYQLKNAFRPKLEGVISSLDNKLPIPFMNQTYAFLESRLDMSIHRALFASSALQARQLVLHGKVHVNGKPERRAYRQLLPGDLVTVDQKSVMNCVSASSNNTPSIQDGKQTEQVSSKDGENEKKKDNDDDLFEQTSNGKLPSINETISNFVPKPFMSLMAFIPAYLEVCFRTCSFVYVRDPVARPGLTEVPSPFPEDLHALAYTYYIRSRNMRQGAARCQARRLIPQKVRDASFYQGPPELYKKRNVSPKEAFSHRYPVRQGKLTKLV
ncbi:37S ribosomal protein S4-like, mitochondrial [Schizosaccharomyces pombe]|uniref:Small ribosomal subunit protein uS4m n=1 Tax=Schizosaccharomyces pombe (strain 972 / ATCC 24843) TaxID=284812 RepID=NAM9_SCHPO|nr:putative mitochondrial ribosomal protein subunit S4 [Schizosaccharomyces pombe]O60063.1 RecName: Full=Small ribosomal subunit protein uS4m; AltName: Full=37S ribosomal protein S4-like, mitochondrial [Schizosaccharomyces pombe 972h-]CAA18654.1 mitochondrial ribosomal protein subunit S4 (predicted) [Schizosaccharomyces pombe]|eukprot:NP_596550.1 putative mitochondrial ribosomal protein subunit S4 [Schizosaccharomyces pombe]